MLDGFCPSGAVEVTKLNFSDKMGNVHPQALVSSTPCYLSSKQESFTVWMKSLVLSGKGCTVFDSDKMGNVHPQTLVSSTPRYLSSKQESFTVWMKSLVLSGKGCTVFDSDGDVVYRVDNYDYKSSNEVHLMDFEGKVLFTILRKKFKLLGFWEGYRSSGSEIDKTKPGFQVRKTLRLLRGDSSCKVTVGLDKNQAYQYKIENWTSKSTYKIVDKSGVLIAEVKRKESAGGVVLGEDVLTMVVEPCIDHSLIMGLLVVYSLINSKL